METININTGMDGFVLLGKITDIGTTAVSSVRQFSDTPDHIGIESLAQLGAMFMRHLIDFDRHVFLLKIKDCTMPRNPVLNGAYRLSGSLMSKSDHTCVMRLIAEEPETNDNFGGVFYFHSVEYDPRFDQQTLRTHYRKVFSCLKNE